VNKRWQTNKRRTHYLDWLPSFLQTPTKLLIRLVLVGLIISACIGSFYFFLASRFNLDEVSHLPRRSIILDRKGREIASLNNSGRRLATREELPDFLVDSLLAREDAKFFSHPGIDIKGLIRATGRNIKDRSFTQGASTLSMQLARNTFEIRAKSIHRKLLEIALTLRVENRYSKDEILTHYLNRIYFGSGCHGIDAAAHKYFGRSVSRLNESQCAMLAGIIRGPHIFSPLRNLEAACEQRDQVLKRLQITKKITAEEVKQIRSQELYLRERKPSHKDGNYAVQAIRRHLEEITTSIDIRQGGLNVYSTIDLALQARLDDRIDAILSTFADVDTVENPLQVAAITLDTATGEILALSGGRDYTQSQFNRALDAHRNLGGAFEPLVLCSAAERGKLPIPGKAIQTGRLVGGETVQRIAERCGIKGPFNKNDELFRGYVSSTPLEWTTAMSTLYAQGAQMRTYFIDSIKLKSGISIFQNKTNITQILDPDSTREARKMLGNARNNDFFVRLTLNRYDLWSFCGVGSRTVIFWIGHDQPQRLPEDSRSRMSRLLKSFSFDK